MSARKGSRGDVQLQREAKTEEAGPADRSQEKTAAQAQPDMGGWETAGAKTKRPTNTTNKSKGTGNLGHDSSAEPNRERKMSPTKYASTKRGKEPPKGLNGGAGSRADKGDGSVVFQQLRSCLQNQASQAYVTHTVLRLNDLARERRFKSYLRTMPAEERRTQAEDEIKKSWKDEAPQRRQDKFEGLRSKWNVQSTKHQDRLYNLMRKWVLEENEEQREIEDRLQFFQFEGRVAAEDQPQKTPERVGRTLKRPTKPTNQLRQRTDDEVKAIVMILNHELEVPHVPPFLAQTMGPGELAVYEDLFLALEYPLV
ncbi:hypothetical protein PF005_g19023 [Phytophthora fragariae]|uniref:Uncharacterized protein n=1 Tax=Phytophthora fragariae TaxID=53985 RepID=A0A6A3X1G4_9STRA|nr:hypothetical protein PF005_g19023 [Phytophthora fragariae]